MPETVILRRRYRSHGSEGATVLREASSREDLARLIQDFGHAVAVRESDETWEVDCATSRGLGGANRLHKMACSRSILVHIV